MALLNSIIEVEHGDPIDIGECIFDALESEAGRFLLASLLDIDETALDDWKNEALSEPEPQEEY